MDIYVVESKLRSILSAIEHPTAKIDAKGRLHVLDQATNYAGWVEVDKALLSGAANEGNLEPTTQKVDIPVLAPSAFLAPRINPTLWGDFCPIKTFDPNPPDPPPTSWQGAISEKVTVYIGEAVEFHERLRIEFAWELEDPEFSRVEFSLLESFSGRLLIDQGFVRALPLKEDFLSQLIVEKTVLLRGEFWADLTQQQRECILRAALLYWFVIYSVRVSLALIGTAEGLDFIERLDKADWQRYLQLLAGLEEGKGMDLLRQAIEG